MRSPGIVVAISLVYVGVRRAAARSTIETPLLVLGYVVLFLPLRRRCVRSSIEQSPVRLEEVARSLGLGPRACSCASRRRSRCPGITAARRSCSCRR
jgi:iron(III) transport system permease protein